jgi:hypothetical protein
MDVRKVAVTRVATEPERLAAAYLIGDANSDRSALEVGEPTE